MNADGTAPRIHDPRPTPALLELIYDSVSDAIMLLAVEPAADTTQTTVALRIVSVNPAFTRATQIPESSAVGKLLQQLGDGNDRPSRFREACGRAVVEKCEARFEEHVEFRGRRIDALIRVTPILDDGGRVTHVLSVSRDITHETQVMEALRAGEQNLEATLRSIGDGVVTTDTEGRIVRMNPNAEVLTGSSLAEARGRSLHEVLRFIDARTQASIPSPATSVLRQRASMELAGDTAVLAKDGRERAVHVSAAPIQDVIGDVSGVVLIVRDVTPERRAAAEKKTVEAERRKTETALRESEARYRTQFEHAPEAIVTLDVDAGRFVEANGNALRLFGCTREELLALGPLEVSPQVQADGRMSWEVAAEIIARAVGGDSPVVEWTVVAKSGRYIPCEIRLVRLPGAGVHVRASVIDITERKEAAALLEENRLIQAANRLKSEFVANMSHELRTPLNAILGFAELLHDGKVGGVSAEQRECLSDVLMSGRHLLSLINGMLDLAKVESGRMEIRREQIELKVLVGEVTDVLRALASRKRISLSSRVDSGFVDVDPARLKQVLFNYVSNAIKFTDEGGVVQVVAMVADHELRFEVSDTGVGIHDDDLAKLFIEFSQLDAGMSKRHEGTGLGLALTKRIVEAQGGKVGVRSVAGKGSTFFAVLPR